MSMRISCCLFLLALLASCGGAQSGTAASNWQGTWKMVSTMYNGQPQTADMLWIVEGDHYNIVLNGARHPDPYNIKLDPATGRVDVFHHETPKGTSGGSLKGIYKISGDTLTVCYDLTGAQYPRSFDAGPGSRRVLYRFQRQR